ncbi:Uncharacterised protein [uncultured archaeon]|nr:Uncharacterised protein [uncultured archaeon]
MHIDALRIILVKEFGKPEKTSTGVDIVNILFKYEEETLETGQISGYFMPLAGDKKTCMWLKKKDGKYTCKLFWNKTAKMLVGFAEQGGGKDKGCSYGGVKRVAIIPMVYRDGVRGLAMASH